MILNLRCYRCPHHSYDYVIHVYCDLLIRLLLIRCSRLPFCVVLLPTPRYRYHGASTLRIALRNAAPLRVPVRVICGRLFVTYAFTVPGETHTFTLFVVTFVYCIPITFPTFLPLIPVYCCCGRYHVATYV